VYSEKKTTIFFFGTRKPPFYLVLNRNIVQLVNLANYNTTIRIQITHRIWEAGLPALMYVSFDGYLPFRLSTQKKLKKIPPE